MADSANFNLQEIVIEIIGQADERAMRLPFILCAISPNGSLSIIRVRENGPDDMLAEHLEPEGFQLPMTVVLIDQDNKALLADITASEKMVLRH